MSNGTDSAQPLEPCVLTISRQLGSGGALIGRDLARRLGMPCYDREILQRAAEQFDVSEDVLEEEEERGKTFWQSLIESFAAGSPEGVYYPPPLRTPTEGELREVESTIITHIAKTQSAIIVGRGGRHVLQAHPRHISVFLHAAESFRLRRVQELYHVSADEARDMLEESDHDRARYHASFSGADWVDARQYSLCFHVSSLGIAATADTLYDYWQTRFGSVCGN
ncbi:MAG: cytidylate kinase-like family protein [Armatimonadia bacterium]